MLATIFYILSGLCIAGAAICVVIAYKVNKTSLRKVSINELAHAELRPETRRPLTEMYAMNLFAQPKPDQFVAMNNATSILESYNYFLKLYGSLDDSYVVMRQAIKTASSHKNETQTKRNTLNIPTKTGYANLRSTPAMRGRLHA